MLVERIEGKWIEVFARVFEMCAVNDTQSAAILSETQSRSVNVNLAELALDRLGIRPIHIVLPTLRQSAPVPDHPPAPRRSWASQGPCRQASA